MVVAMPSANIAAAGHFRVDVHVFAILNHEYGLIDDVSLMLVVVKRIGEAADSKIQ